MAYLPIPVQRGGPKKMEMHEQFANLPDQPEAFQLFIKRWGALMGPERLPHELELEVRNKLRAAWRGQENLFSKPERAMPTSLTVEKDLLKIQPHDLADTLRLLFLRDHWAGKTAICANADCLTPYFIKRRRNQKYCEAGACTEQAQREQKRLWWARNRGKESDQ